MISRFVDMYVILPHLSGASFFEQNILCTCDALAPCRRNRRWSCTGSSRHLTEDGGVAAGRASLGSRDYESLMDSFQTLARADNTSPAAATCIRRFICSFDNVLGGTSSAYVNLIKRFGVMARRCGRRAPRKTTQDVEFCRAGESG